MRRAQTFVKKTRKGAVLKVVREHYLRDDVVCGSQACDECDKSDATVLEAAGITTLFAQRHYVLPDTNVFLHQMDVLQHAFFHDVIVLETVLEEVKHRSVPIYNRARELIANPARRFYVFLNEHHRDTYIEREKDESPNDRNDRAIRTAAMWYKQHLEQAALDVVLLTEDADNLAKAKELGCTCSTVFAYVEAVKGMPELQDALARPNARYSDAAFDPYIEADIYEAGLKTGKYIKGTFNISPYDHSEGFVWVHGSDGRVIIEGSHNRNRAVQDDQVVVEILPKSQWQRPSTKVSGGDKKEKPSGSLALAIDEPMMSDKDLVQTGKIVAVIKRYWRAYCGSLLLDNAVDGKVTTAIFVPVDHRIPRIRVQTRQAAQLQGKRIVVAIDEWEHTSLHPTGHYVRTIGDIGDRATETEVILIEYDIPHQPFTPPVTNCLPPAGDHWTVNEHGGNDERRQDLRHLAVCSVDPPGCTDIDDALHVRKLPNGNYEVGVHIADVTHFVRPNTAMDAEASHRGTTVYLVDRRIDMLPELLGSNLCSLRCNVDRFAFSCLWEMNDEGRTLSARFCKSIIRSRASLTYDQAQARIDDKVMDDPITKSLRILNQLAKKLNAERRRKGALTLASPEVRFALENDSQDPVDVEMKEMKEVNSMVEEFMLVANIAVARKIHEVFSQCSLLRRHAVPAPSRFEYLLAATASCGITIDPTSSKTLAESLDKAIVPDKPHINRLVRILTTRCMTQAQYICSGVHAPEQYLHFGLAAEIYTHFTSPIRRYADVVVHRLLAAAVDADTTFPEMLDKDNIHRVCNNLNRRHKLAQLSGRGSVQLYTVLYFRGKQTTEKAHIIRLLQNGIVVLVPRYGIESVITLAAETDSHTFEYDAERQVLSSALHGVSFHLFDTVTVQIETDESDKLEMKLVTLLVEPHVAGVSPKPTAAASSSVKRGPDGETVPTPKRVPDDEAVPTPKKVKSLPPASSTASPSPGQQDKKKKKKKNKNPHRPQGAASDSAANDDANDDDMVE